MDTSELEEQDYGPQLTFRKNPRLVVHRHENSYKAPCSKSQVYRLVKGDVLALVEKRLFRAPSVPIFLADHPFLFAIRDRNSDTILFLGRMADPTCEH